MGDGGGWGGGAARPNSISTHQGCSLGCCGCVGAPRGPNEGPHKEVQPVEMMSTTFLYSWQEVISQVSSEHSVCSSTAIAKQHRHCHDGTEDGESDLLAQGRLSPSVCLAWPLAADSRRQATWMLLAKQKEYTPDGQSHPHYACEQERLEGGAVQASRFTSADAGMEFTGRVAARK